uniref:Uncharacterized protein n=1 Tax=Romanomermis culicivorax TaxID=13658 RepID=A0A915IN61_ROMCU
MRKLIRKAPARINLFKERTDSLPLPPDAIVTRWETWIQTGVFYCNNYNKIVDFVNALPDENTAASVKVAKKLVENNILKNELVNVATFSVLAEVIQKLEKRGWSKDEQFTMMFLDGFENDENKDWVNKAFTRHAPPDLWAPLHVCPTLKNLAKEWMQLVLHTTKISYPGTCLSVTPDGSERCQNLLIDVFYNLTVWRKANLLECKNLKIFRRLSGYDPCPKFSFGFVHFTTRDFKGYGFVGFRGEQQILPAFVRRFNFLFVSRHESVSRIDAVADFRLIDVSVRVGRGWHPTRTQRRLCQSFRRADVENP